MAICKISDFEYITYARPRFVAINNNFFTGIKFEKSGRQNGRKANRQTEKLFVSHSLSKSFLMKFVVKFLFPAGPFVSLC